jgi:sugar lactone lactonase YvrE
VVSTLAGLSGSAGSANGRGGDARFTAPTGLATDATGNLYVAEGSLRTLRKISPDGTVTNFAGATGQFGSVDGVGTTARFGYPSSVATDAKGNVYVSDGDNFNIRKITPDGIVSTLAGATRLPGLKDGTGSEAQFSNPGGLAVDAAGNVYVAERDGPTIRKITPAGVVTTFAGRTGVGGSIDGPRGVACLVRPESIVIDQTGNFFVTDGSTTVRKITPEGAITTVAGRWQNPGTVDGPGSEARFVSASGLTIDPLGNLFVVELNGLVRRIDPSFVVTTLAGKAGSFGSSDGSGTAVRFNFPTSITMDPGGDIYIADTDNNTIRKGVSNTRLVNLSVRAVAGSGDQTLIVGFVVAGALAPKPVLVRAVGPTLVDLGIINSLPNPRLKLYNVAGAPLRENDDWGGSAELRDLFARLGAYPLEAGSKDAAISTALTPGVYTAHVTSADASTGIALLETYDADRTSSARLVNASVRAVSGGGQNVVIAGFVLVGTAPKSVLVRAIGPSLVSHGLGLASLLQDPQLTLYNGSVMIGNNDDWGGAAALKSSFARVGAFVPDSETSKDAALLVTLDPGLYSVVVSGGSNQAGVVLVEVYEMP